MLANRVYPGLVHHKRWARNGFIPDAKFAKELVRAVNHINAYRRKTFASFGDLDNIFGGASGSTVQHRFRCHTGYAATHIAFDLALCPGDAAGDGAGVDPRIQIDVTVAGGATTTHTIHYGLAGGVPSNAPNSFGWFNPKVPVSADTTYEVTITAINYGRVVAGGAYEVASNVVDSSVAWFVDDNPSSFFPIYDRFRKQLLQATSDIWKRNGSHLLSWTGNNGSASPLFSGNTWTNVIDGTTAVAASSAGYYLGADSQTLEPWCRISEPTEMHVVFAAHVTVNSTVGGTGELRLQDGSGTRLSLTGITGTSQWYSTTTSFADVTAFQRLDLQARTSTAANTGMTLNAVSVYAYVT